MLHLQSLHCHLQVRLADIGVKADAHCIQHLAHCGERIAKAPLESLGDEAAAYVAVY